MDQAQEEGKQIAEEARQQDPSKPSKEAAPQQMVAGGAPEAAVADAETVAVVQPVDGDAAGEAAPMAIDEEAWILKVGLQSAAHAELLPWDVVVLQAVVGLWQ